MENIFMPQSSENFKKFPVIFRGLHPLGETGKLGTGCDWGLVYDNSRPGLVV
jgi:hypothetical protein